MKYSLSLMRRCVRWLRSGLVTHSHRVTDSRPPKLKEPMSTNPFSSHSLRTEWAWQQSITQGLVFSFKFTGMGTASKNEQPENATQLGLFIFKILFHFYGCMWTPVCGCLWRAEEGVWFPAVASCSPWVPLIEQQGFWITAFLQAVEWPAPRRCLTVIFWLIWVHSHKYCLCSPFLYKTWR